MLLAINRMNMYNVAYPEDGATLVTVPVNRWTSACWVFLPEINNNNYYGVPSHVYCTYMHTCTYM